MKETIMYCQEHTRPNEEKFYTHFYLHPRTTRICDDESLVLKVKVREVREGEESTYWAWWSFREDHEEFIFCYPTKTLLGMCFPYGMKAAEEHGEGIGVNVMIEIIEVIKNV